MNSGEIANWTTRLAEGDTHDEQNNQTFTGLMFYNCFWVFHFFLHISQAQIARFETLFSIPPRLDKA
jgi:hypothetical protein